MIKLSLNKKIDQKSNLHTNVRYISFLEMQVIIYEKL